VTGRAALDGQDPRGNRNEVRVNDSEEENESMEFLEFPKMARLTRECIITEKIDGTNAQIAILAPDDTSAIGPTAQLAIAANRELGLVMLAGSRTQWITPERDNFGFAKWVQAHAAELWALGEGRHYGEWWGQGIQRGYGLTEKRFSLFNTSRWADERDREKYPTDRPACCHVVPVLYQGLFGPKHDENFLAKLRHEGSMAAPGFMKPEGIVVYHTAAGVSFKKTLEKDDMPKSRAGATSAA
jgi:RNA ligase-like protein